MTDLRAVVFGTTGGIGAALVAQLEASGRYGIVYAGARNPKSNGTVFSFDLTDEDSIAQAAAMIGAAGPIDLVIVATGVLSGPDLPAPEKSWRAIDGDAMARMFAVNTIGPALIGKHFLPLLRRDSRSVLAMLSARVGSIGDNRLGGWHSYRASKAALNMLVRNFAIELATRNRLGIVAGIHPGTVDTALSRPFQRGVAPAALLQADASAALILATIDTFTPEDSGGLFAWQGERIAY